MAKQGELEGVPSREVVPEVTAAAEAYEKARDAWMATGEPVRKAKQTLIDTMKAHGMSVYIEDDLRVELRAGKDSVKVRRGDDADADAE